MKRVLEVSRLVATPRIPARLTTALLMCASLAFFASGAEPSGRPEAVGRASLSSNDQASAAPIRDVIARSTTVVTREEVGSPDVRALPSVATSSSELSPVALNAYMRAAEVIDSVKPGCHLSWTVLAAIGQVESDHGRSAGGHLLADGTASRPVRGEVLDGSGTTAKVVDTDGGQLDGNPQWDRGVGPMQFLPSTWITVRVDGDGDGVRSPDDLYDATLSAAVFLCAWDQDVSSAAGAGRAVGRYNHTRGYVPAVLALARQYDAGTYDNYGWAAALTWTLPTTPLVATPVTPAPQVEVRARPVTTTQADSGPALGPGPAALGAQGVSPSPTHRPSPTLAASPASSTPADASPATPSTDPSAPDSSGPTSGPAPDPVASSSPTSAPSPDPSPATGTPDSNAPSSTVTTVTGTLQACGVQQICVDDILLDLGSLDTPAAADFDGDGTTGSRQAELAGLLGAHVTVEVQDGSVVTLDGQAW